MPPVSSSLLIDALGDGDDVLQHLVAIRLIHHAVVDQLVGVDPLASSFFGDAEGGADAEALVLWGRSNLTLALSFSAVRSSSSSSMIVVLVAEAACP